MNKPKPGFEARFAQIFRIVQGIEIQKPPGFWAKLNGKRLMTREELIQEFQDSSIEAYETIKAPRVGVDAVADEWIRARYAESDKSCPKASLPRTSWDMMSSSLPNYRTVFHIIKP